MNQALNSGAKPEKLGTSTTCRCLPLGYEVLAVGFPVDDSNSIFPIIQPALVISSLSYSHFLPFIIRMYFIWALYMFGSI